MPSAAKVASLETPAGPFALWHRVPRHPSRRGSAIVLHGRNGAAHSAHILPIVEALRHHGFEVFVPDMRFSDANESAGAGRDFTIAGHVADAAMTLDHVAAATPEGCCLLLAGHSLGAYAALSLAADRGAAAIGAVLAVSPAISGAALIAARRAMGAPAVAALAEEVPGALEEYPRHDILPRAHEITQPVGLVVGARDGLTPPSVVAGLADALPRVVAHEVLPDADHCPTGPAVEAALDRVVGRLVQTSQ